MKKLSLLFFVFVALTQMAAQEFRSDFGLVLKAGNFALPYSGLEAYSSYQSVYSMKKVHHPGASYVFGVYKKWALGKHFALSGELLYRYSGYSFRWESNSFSNSSSYRVDSQFDQTIQERESNISLPVKLHFAFQQNGKTSIAVGVGVSQVFGAEIRQSSEYTSLYPTAVSAHSIGQPFWNTFQDFTPRLTLTAGFYQQLNGNTQVGLEFTYERRDLTIQNPFYPSSGPKGTIDCICYYDDSDFMVPKLQSFTLLIQHRLLP